LVNIYKTNQSINQSKQTYITQDAVSKSAIHIH